MKNKGQALVEFVLIMPVLLIILLAIIDFGTIFKTKYDLQNDLDLIAELYKEDKTDDYNNYVWNHNLDINVIKNNNLTTIEISKKVQIKAPILSKVFQNPYSLTESMTIYES